MQNRPFPHHPFAEMAADFRAQVLNRAGIRRKVFQGGTGEANLLAR